MANMFLEKLKRFVQTLAVQVACLSMVISPVAMGKEAETLNEQKLHMYLQDFGLNKKTTLGEFWEKSKIYFPGYVYQDLEKFVAANKNMPMPEITVTNAKATDGTTVPALRITAGGKTTTVQIFDEPKRWAKYNNVVLSEADMRNPADAFKRIEASDLKVKKEADKYLESKSSASDKKKAEEHKELETVVKDFARFRGFPHMTPMEWKALTPTQRAGYIVNMRLLWKDARRVLRIEQSARLQKTPAGGKKFSSFDEFSKILIGEAQAAGLGTTKKQPKLSKFGQSVTNEGLASAPENPEDKKCIIAGYVSSEGRGTNYGTERAICSDEAVFKTGKYQDNPIVQAAQADCTARSANNMSCNPMVYGYQADGGAICVDKTHNRPSDPAVGNFQKATWWDGPCDSQGKLTENQVQDGMKATDREYSDQDKRFDENGKIKADTAQTQINLVEADQFKNDSYKNTKSYLDSVLKNKQMWASDAKNQFTMDDLISGKKPWSKDIDDMLVDIQGQFETEINEAIQSCEKSITRKDNVDRNQKGACDQLHRRWLFTERFLSQYRAKSCLNGSTYIWQMDDSKMSQDQIDLAKLNKEKIKSQDELMCQCNDGSGRHAKFGDANACTAATPLPPISCPEGMIKEVDGYCVCPGEGNYMSIADASAKAKAGEAPICKPNCPMPTGIENYDYNKCECSKGELKDDNEQGFISKIFNGKQEPKDPKWVCKEANLLPWVLGGLGLVALFAVFNHHKKIVPPKPVTCTLTCGANSTLNPAACKCDQNPPPSCAPKTGVYPNCMCSPSTVCVPGQALDAVTCQCGGTPVCPDGSKVSGGLYICPKCSDGSFRTLPGSGRPDGCPQSSEGGSGTNQCKDANGVLIPCSGGIPTGTGAN